MRRGPEMVVASKPSGHLREPRPDDDAAEEAGRIGRSLEPVLANAGLPAAAGLGVSVFLNS